MKLYLQMKEEDEKNEKGFKVLVVGDVGTGKTSFIKRYVRQYFSVHYKPTVSFESH